MTDTTFQWSLTILSILALLWMIVGSILINNVLLPVLTGFIIIIIGGGTLLYYWGKSYMSRL